MNALKNVGLNSKHGEDPHYSLFIFIFFLIGMKSQKSVIKGLNSVILSQLCYPIRSNFLEGFTYAFS